jgi:Uma2 family endonuclease
MAHPAHTARLESLAQFARYLGPSQPRHFPESEEVPETQLHLDLRTLLYLQLTEYLGERYTVGSNQFVYYDASNPKRCLAPDVYIKCTPRGEPVRSWKIWERGAPDVAVEIISDSDSILSDWDVKLSQYHTLGIRELLRLDLVTDTAPRLRVWNRVDGGLQERDIEGETAPSLVLNLTWTIAAAQHLPAALRIAQPEDPTALVPTAEEARKIEAEARKIAEARVAELEALLKSRG